MKKILLVCLLCQSTATFSQSNEEAQPATITFKTYGYINGKRLDSIDAIYATFTLNNSTLTFDYGQLWNKRKELIVKDSNGVNLLFANGGNMPFALNFFYFNGWQLDHINNNNLYDNFIFILKKCNRQ